VILKLRDVLAILAIMYAVLSSVAPLADTAMIKLPPLVSFGIMLLLVALQATQTYLQKIALEAEKQAASPSQGERIAELEQELAAARKWIPSPKTGTATISADHMWPAPVAVPEPPAPSIPRHDTTGETLPAYRKDDVP